MSQKELLSLIEPLSLEEKRELRVLLDEELDWQSEWDKMQAANPLKGSVLAYEDPFGPAAAPNEWEALRDSD